MNNSLLLMLNYEVRMLALNFMTMTLIAVGG